MIPPSFPRLALPLLLSALAPPASADTWAATTQSFTATAAASLSSSWARPASTWPYRRATLGGGPAAMRR